MAAGLALSLRPAPLPSPSLSSTRGLTRRCLAPPPPHGRLAVRLLRPGVACRAATAFQKLDAVAVREEEATFRAAAAAGHDLLPLRRCIFSDHHTPVLAYRCLVREDDREAPSFLFESVEQGSQGTNVFAPTYNEYVLYNHNEGDNSQAKYPSESTVPNRRDVELAGITVVASNSPVISSVSTNQVDQDESMTTPIRNKNTPIRNKVDPPGRHLCTTVL